MSKKLMNFILLFFLILLLLFPSQCIEAGKEGLLLWFQVIVPTLFPFIILSYIIVHSSLIDMINRIFSPFFKKILGISGFGSYAFIMGSLSGYPMGSVIIQDLLTSNSISKKEAAYLLTFCNNASPMFIIGFICAGLLHQPKLGLPMLITIYLGNFITALFFKNIDQATTSAKYVYKKKKTVQFSFDFFDECIQHTAELLVKVGGYIIISSIPIVLLANLPIQNDLYKFIISLIELSNGANLLAYLPSPTLIKFAFLCSLCAFGSLSVIGQTASAIKNSGLSIKRYCVAKTVNCMITFAIACVLIFLYQKWFS